MYFCPLFFSDQMTVPWRCTFHRLVHQPCLFWMTDAIFAWRVNPYLISLSQQYHLVWDSHGIVTNSAQVISCVATLVQTLDHSVTANIESLLFFYANSTNYIFKSISHPYTFSLHFHLTLYPYNHPNPLLLLFAFFPAQRYGRLCSFDLLSIRGLKINYAGSHA